MHANEKTSTCKESKGGSPLYKLSVFYQPKFVQPPSVPPPPPPPPRKSPLDHQQSDSSLTDPTGSLSTVNSDLSFSENTLNTSDMSVHGNRLDRQPPLHVKTPKPVYNRTSSMENSSLQLQSTNRTTSMPDLNKISVVYRNFPPPPPPRRHLGSIAVGRRFLSQPPPPPPPRRS